MTERGPRRPDSEKRYPFRYRNDYYNFETEWYYLQSIDMIKKLNCFCCLFFAVLLLSSCTYDPYSDQRPFDYGNAEWISETPEIYFSVDTAMDEYYYPLGRIMIDDTEYLCKFWFIHQTNQLHILVYMDENATPEMCIGEIKGDCDFFPDHFIMYIDYDTVFDGQYNSIIFYKDNVQNNVL